MLKYIIYWMCYTSSFYNLECENISGVITIDSDSVSTYLWPNQYVKWKIVGSKGVIVEEDKITSGIYYLKYNEQITSTLTINRKYVEQLVIAPDIHYKDRIKVKIKQKLSKNIR